MFSSPISNFFTLITNSLLVYKCEKSHSIGGIVSFILIHIFLFDTNCSETGITAILSYSCRYVTRYRSYFLYIHIISLFYPGVHKKFPCFIFWIPANNSRVGMRTARKAGVRKAGGWTAKKDPVKGRPSCSRGC